MRVSAMILAGALVSTAAGAQELPPHVREGGDPLGRVHASLRAELVGGMFAPALGGALRATVGWTAWNTAGATGTFDVGASLGLLYGDEHLYPWVNPRQLQGTDLQLTAAALIGHTFHIGRARRFSLGVHGFMGWSHFIQQWTVDFSGEGYRDTGRGSRGWMVYGPEISVAYRVATRLSVGASVSGAWPWDAGGSILRAGVGITVHLR